VRAALGLPAMPTRYPEGRPPRPAATRQAVRATSATSRYCTLGVAKGTITSLLPS